MVIGGRCKHWDHVFKGQFESLSLEDIFLDSSKGKEPAYSAGDLGSIPGLGKSPGKGHGNLPQYSGLENSMERGAWQAVHGVSKNGSRLSDQHFHFEPLGERGYYIISMSALLWFFQ